MLEDAKSGRVFQNVEKLSHVVRVVHGFSETSQLVFNLVNLTSVYAFPAALLDCNFGIFSRAILMFQIGRGCFLSSESVTVE